MWKEWLNWEWKHTHNNWWTNHSGETHIMDLIHHILDTGKSEAETLRLFRTHNIHVENIVLSGIDCIGDFPESWTVENITIRSPEEIEFENSLGWINLQDFVPVNKLSKLQAGDKVELELRWFLWFVITSVNWMVTKWWNQYASCMISAIKISKENWTNNATKKSIINKKVLISLPIEINKDLQLYDEMQDKIMSFKIFNIKTLKPAISGIKNMFKRLIP